MRKMILATAAALASLILMSNIASNVAMTRPAHAQDNVAQVWLVTALITDTATGESKTDGPMYFRQDDPTYRFADKAACDAYLTSGDERLAAANAGLTKQIDGLFGDGAKVEFLCTVEIRE